jgi:uncharacterized membrane protein (UPF0127 family)
VAWLIRDGEVLASLEMATSWRARTRGLLGRGSVDGALLLRPARSVHTIAMRFPIDAAFLDDRLVVLRIVRLRPWRLTRVMVHAHAVLEAEAGAFAEWNLKPGDRLEVKG